MAGEQTTTARIAGYCALCASRCGSIAVVEDGRFVALEPDPSHPTGQALCAKGRAAPELVDHPDRLLRPLRRTRPKGDRDPGWQEITWDEALDATARRLRELAERHGPESVVFSMVSWSTSAIGDAAVWIQRLMRAFGSPNLCGSMELCGWGRFYATRYTFGTGMGAAGTPMPDLENAGCIVFWGYNPSLSRLAHATAAVAALRRGARLIVVDPRRVGLASKAHLWLRVRPGSDGALALGIANVMIERGWYDRAFARDWTNGPLLVRADNGRLLTEADLAPGGSALRYVAWDAETGRPLVYDPARRRYERDGAEPSLFGEHTLGTPHGPVTCRTVFELCAEACRPYSPAVVEATCEVARGHVERAARLLWESRPVALYAWSGVEQQSNATQIFRALALLYALTGSFDAPGGNVLFPSVPTADVAGAELISPSQRDRALGLPERPLGPSRWEWVTTDEVYTAILEQRPYAVRGLVGFGANLLLAHADVRRGRTALAALDFYVHADLFMNPTAELADIVLPVATAFEREGLKIGFDVSPAAQSLVQLRPPVVAPRGEARSDTDIVFDLACRLGLGAHFWGGDVDAAYRHQLGPSGLSLDALRANPAGLRVPLRTRYRKYAEQKNGVARGFATPTGKIELYSETFLEHGYPPLPCYEEPLVSPRSRPDLAERFPLILTCAKHTQFCQSQHRALPSLRRRAPGPEVELPPGAARERGIRAGDWVSVETPEGRIRARARLNESLAPGVVSAQHGWWQACPEIGAQGYDPFGPDGANLNLVIGNAAIDPVSGSVPHRAYLCQIRPADEHLSLEERVMSIRTTTAAAALDQWVAGLRAAGLDAPWTQPGPLIRPKASAMQARVWRWREIEPLLRRSPEFMRPGRGAERRILRLDNPGVPERTAGHTISIAVQYLLPGEIAPAHRHTPNALRFMLHGAGAYTTIEGDRFVMRRGDLVVTPSMTWHDHGNEGAEPVIWTDALDSPVVRYLENLAMDPYEGERQPVRTGPPARHLHYRWEAAYAELRRRSAGEPDPFDDVIMEYVDPATGRPVVPALGCYLQMVRPGVRTRAHRETSSAVYHVVGGAGYTEIDGVRHAWGEGDFFAVPPRALHAHGNEGTLPAILYSVQDVPLLRALGFYRMEA